MSKNTTNTYAFDTHVAEIHDQIETGTVDIEMILQLISRHGPLRILEPFCGTGRILLPLAAAGHEVVGIDQAATMLDRARMKIARQPSEIQRRITLIHADATASPWPQGFDVVLLAGNCFYELACAEEQEGSIAAAAAALQPGGYLFADSDHMEGELALSWRQPGRHKAKFPSGACEDGTRVEGTSETLWYDAPARLVRFRRTITVTSPTGRTASTEWIQQKHPVSTDEIRGWLERHGLVIEQHYGSEGKPYTDASGRTTFWARKPL